MAFSRACFSVSPLLRHLALPWRLSAHTHWPLCPGVIASAAHRKSVFSSISLPPKFKLFCRKVNQASSQFAHRAALQWWSAHSPSWCPPLFIWRRRVDRKLLIQVSVALHYFLHGPPSSCSSSGPPRAKPLCLMLLLFIFVPSLGHSDRRNTLPGFTAVSNKARLWGAS